MFTKLDTNALDTIHGGNKAGVVPGDGGCVPSPFPRPRPPLGGTVGVPVGVPPSLPFGNPGPFGGPGR